MPMPDFIMIGAPKAGTSSIFNYLGQHPNIYTPALKEPGFFLFDGEVPDYRGPGDGNFYSRAVPDEQNYASMFEDARGRIAGEATTLYLEDEAAARRIAEKLPHAKLIAVLRNPIDRAFSHYWMLRYQNRETESFARALDLAETRLRANWASQWHYVRYGFYAAQLERYFAHFPREQIHVTLYDDFERAPEDFMRAMFDFLGVDATFKPRMRQRYNVSGEPKSTAVSFLLTSRHPVRQGIKLLMPRRIRISLREWLRVNFLQKPEMSAGCRDQLRNTYAADIARLEDMLERDLSHWLA